MEEIKAPLHKRIIYFLYAHIALFGLLILIAVVLFSSCGKAKAEGLPDNLEEIISNDFTNHSYDYSDYSSYFTDILNRDDLNVVRIRRSENDIVYYFYMYYGIQIRTNYSNGYFPFWGFDTYLMNVAPRGTTWDTSKVCYYALTITNSAVKLDAFKPHRSNYYDNLTLSLYSFPSYVPTNGDGAYGTSLGISITACNMHADYKSVVFNSGNGTYNSLYGIYDSDSIICSSDFYYLNNGSTAFYKEANWDTYYPPSVEDNRLKLSTIMDNGRKELAIDFSDFFTEEYASSYQINDLTLTISYDGTEQEITGLSQYYQSISTTDKMAFIPYTALGFDSNNEIQYNDVEVVNCSFTKAVIYPNRPGTTEDFNILCSYYLKKTTVPIEADTVNLDDTIYEDVVSDTTITDTLNEIGVTSTSNSDGVWSNFTLVNTLPTFPSWCSTINIAIWQSKVWENGAWSYRDEWYYKGDDLDYNTWYHEAYPFDLPYANNYAQYYDVLIINLGDGVKEMSVAGTPHDFPSNQAWGDYIILYSARYYQHKNVEGLYSLIDAFQKDANQSKENWSYLKERLDDFENKTLEAMTSTTEPTSIFYKLNTLDNDLMNGVTRIVNKIPSPFDDTDILDAISDVADAISAISFPTTDMSTTNSLLERINAVLGGQDDESTLLETPYALHNLYPLLQLLNGEEDTLVVFDTTPPSSPSNDVIYITVNSEWWATTFNSIIGGYMGLKGSIPIDDVSDFFITFYDALYGRTIDAVPDYAPGDSEKQITNFNRMFSRIYDYDFDPSLYWGEVQIGE